jgi:DnaJ-class molecular chaperone
MVSKYAYDIGYICALQDVICELASKSGLEVKVKEVNTTCEECGGTGVDPGSGSYSAPEPCPICLGTGREKGRE